MKSIVMAEYDDFNSDFKLGEHHYAQLFAEKGFRVLWLSPIYNQLMLFKNKALYNKRKKMNIRTFIEEESNLYSYAPYSLFLYGNEPLFNTKIACKLSNRFIIPSIKDTLKINGFKDIDILWLSNPKYFYLKELIQHKKLIYRCADDVPNDSNVVKSMKDFEARIFKEASTVFVTSKNIIEKRKKDRKDLIYLPNGVELNNFLRKDYDKPEEFRDNDKKKVLYVGAIKAWFDVELIKYAAKKLLEVEFFFIGPIGTNVEELKNLNNVHFLGKRDYKDIPAYMYYSDVGIIPFIVNEFINGVSPIKLYEYMSTGLSVVSTNFDGIRILDSPAYLANNYEEFTKYLREAITQNNKEKNIKYALNNTWKERFEVIIKETGD